MRLKEFYNLNYACHAYFPPPKQDFVINLASCNDDIYNRSLEHYRNCIVMMKKIGIPFLSVHAGFYIEIDTGSIGGQLSDSVIYDISRANRRFCDAAEELKRIAAAENIMFYIENNVISPENYRRLKDNYLMMTDYHGISEMKKHIDFRLLLDLAHLRVSCSALGLDYMTEAAKLGNLAEWIHISENDGITDQHRLIDFNGEIFGCLKNIYTKNMHVTIESKGTPEELSWTYKELKNRLDNE